MSETAYSWCLRHSRVESTGDVCPAQHLLGPYRTPAEAEQALERVKQRESELEAEDARWEGE
ncbi:MAG: hypothetical protein ACRDUA_15080 [Micromonosporaceae bacterium]